MFRWIPRSSSAVNKRLAISTAAFSPGSVFPPQHYHQAPGTLYSLLGLAEQWSPWPIEDKWALLGRRRGRDIAPQRVEYGFCASPAGAQGTGGGEGAVAPIGRGARGRARLLASPGREWRERVQQPLRRRGGGMDQAWQSAGPRRVRPAAQ